MLIDVVLGDIGDCAIFIDTPEHIISAEPAENQWDTFSWNNIKAKANNIKESCITERGYGGSIPAGSFLTPPPHQFFPHFIVPPLQSLRSQIHLPTSFSDLSPTTANRRSRPSPHPPPRPRFHLPRRLRPYPSQQHAAPTFRFRFLFLNLHPTTQHRGFHDAQHGGSQRSDYLS